MICESVELKDLFRGILNGKYRIVNAELFSNNLIVITNIYQFSHYIGIDKSLDMKHSILFILLTMVLGQGVHNVEEVSNFLNTSKDLNIDFNLLMFFSVQFIVSAPLTLLLLTNLV